MNKLKDGQFTVGEVQFVSTLLGQMPYDKSFPRTSFQTLLPRAHLTRNLAVIDVLRLLALNQSAAKVMSNMRDALGQLLVHHGNSKAPGPNQLMVIRFFANLFKWDFFREFLLQYSDRVSWRGITQLPYWEITFMSFSCWAVLPLNGTERTIWAWLSLRCCWSKSLADWSHSLKSHVLISIFSFTVLYRAQNAIHAKVQTVAILNEVMDYNKQVCCTVPLTNPFFSSWTLLKMKTLFIVHLLLWATWYEFEDWIII